MNKLKNALAVGFLATAMVLNFNLSSTSANDSDMQLGDLSMTSQAFGREWSDLGIRQSYGCDCPNPTNNCHCPGR
jgi:hypothetical protein